MNQSLQEITGVPRLRDGDEDAVIGTTNSRFEIILTISLCVFLLVVAFRTNTTGDSGDSVMHYLFSRYAFGYPSFFLDHWAKPVFVLLSAPFAQFGFKGIVVFNCLCASLTALFTVRTARRLDIKYRFFVVLLMFCSPLYFKLVFSGFTEYLFGLFLILGIYLMAEKRVVLSLVVVSFLPLIRSEGLLILGVFALFLLVVGEYSSLPYLVVGQGVYSCVGGFYHNDLLWVFRKIPYTRLGSQYGNGTVFDFVHRLNYVIEKPIYLLLVIGGLSIALRFFLGPVSRKARIEAFLVLGSFVAVFSAHSVFWWLGLFGSMGLPRVLNAVVPVVSIVALIGLQSIVDRFSDPVVRRTLIGGCAVVVVVFPFLPRPHGVVFDRQLFVVEENRLIDDEVAPFIVSEFPDYTESTVYFSHPYLSVALDVDYFDSQRHRELQDVRPGSLADDGIIIWDDWFGVVEAGVDLHWLQTRFELVKAFERRENDRVITFVVFRPYPGTLASLM